MGASCCCCVTGILALLGLAVCIRYCFQPLLRLFFKLSSNGLPLTEKFGKWAIITGATDGIGEAIAIKLAKQGLNLLLISRNNERLEETKGKIKQLSPNCEVKLHQFDFGFNSKSWTSQLSSLKSIIDGLDTGILINNVGVSYPSALKFEELPDGLIGDLISVNLRSVYELTQIVLPGMRKRQRGAIVCIGSGASEVSTEPLYCGYAGVKAAVESFCRSLQTECVKDNILIQCQTPLLVVSKLSKIRKPTLTVLTAESYAESAIGTLEGSYVSYWLSTTVCPNNIHGAMLMIFSMIPLGVWSRMRLQMTSAIRSKYLNKSKDQ